MTRDEARAVAVEVFGAGALAALRDGLSCSEGTRGHAIAWAENAQGETIGRRDVGPFSEVRMDGVWND
jgi:hypothetical protein